MTLITIEQRRAAVKSQAGRWADSPDGGRGDGYCTWTEAMRASALASGAQDSGASAHGRHYVWPDGSSILVVGSSWDVAARCGICWIGGGHTEECNALTREAILARLDGCNPSTPERSQRKGKQK